MVGHLHSVDAGSESTAEGDHRIRVLIADGHPAMRRILRRLLEQDDEIAVVGEAGDFATAITRARIRRPQVLVLDVRMPGAAGLDSIQELRAHAAGTEVVLVTMENNPTFANRALERGGVGLVLKDAAEVELCEAVRRAVRGEKYRSPSVKDIWPATTG
jgi:two-component system, NarL family, response regulator NreC